MIAVENLLFEYQDKTALNKVSFTIDKGSITALVGPNGAGKTTLMRCMATLQKPQEGSIFVDGTDVINNPHYAHQHMGYLSDFFGLYDELTVRESLVYIACSRINHYEQALEKAARAIEITGVISFADKEISKLSRGMRQRVGIAQAIVHEPKVLLLDEPASGLDPEARYALSELLLSLNRSGMTIMVSSHILAELEDYSTEMLVLNNGMIAEKRPLKQMGAGTLVYRVVVEGMTEIGVASLRMIAAIKKVVQEENLLLITFNEAEMDKKLLLQTILSTGMQPVEFGEHKINMQDEYLRTIKNAQP